MGAGGRGIEGEGGFELLALTLLLTLHRSLRQAQSRWIVVVLGIAIALLAVVPPDRALSQAQGSHDSSKDFDTLKAAGNENPTGIWSNKTTMWVVDATDSIAIFA